MSFSSSNFTFSPSSLSSNNLPNFKRPVTCCKYSFPVDDLNFVLHDALRASGFDTSHAKAARDGFCSEIRQLTDIERRTSISINRAVDLATTALHIAAEDDSLISHSSVPLPVADFVERLDVLSMGYCSYYGSSFRYTPEEFLECLGRYLFVDKGFRRSNLKNQLEQRSLYLHSVLTHRSGSATMLTLIYSEVLKMLRLWGMVNFDAEIFFPCDSHGFPKGYQKQKSKKDDDLHILTSQSLLVEILKDLKQAFWPFQLDHSGSLFLRAAEAAKCCNRSSSLEASGVNIAAAKAAQHRMQRGVWTIVPFGDMRRALAACERLILLEANLNELRDYSVLLYHCGFYEEAMQYLNLYQEEKKFHAIHDGEEEEEAAVEKLITRIKLIMMEEGWSRPPSSPSFLTNSDPW